MNSTAQERGSQVSSDCVEFGGETSQTERAYHSDDGGGDGEVTG